MMRFGHHVVAASVALALPAVLNRFGLAHISSESALSAAVLSQPFSAGRFSPDADQTWLKRAGHRRGVHGWWWPALAALCMIGTPLAGLYWAWGPIIGWTSHLFPADWAFGKGGRSIPKGIPILPCYSGRTGLGWRVCRQPGAWNKIFTPRRRGGHALGELLASLALCPVLAWQVWSTLDLY